MSIKISSVCIKVLGKIAVVHTLIGSKLRFSFDDSNNLYDYDVVSGSVTKYTYPIRKLPGGVTLTSNSTGEELMTLSRWKEATSGDDLGYPELISSFVTIVTNASLDANRVFQELQRLVDENVDWKTFFIRRGHGGGMSLQAPLEAIIRMYINTERSK